MVKFNPTQDAKKAVKFTEIVKQAYYNNFDKIENRPKDSVSVFHSDFWASETGNLAIEFYEDKEKGTLGGPWKAAESHYEPEASLYIMATWKRKEASASNLDKLYVFKSVDLINYCNENEPVQKTNCRNKTRKKEYTTENLIFPISKLKEVALGVIEVSNG